MNYLSCHSSFYSLLCIFIVFIFTNLAFHCYIENILTHTSNAKCFWYVTLINIGGLAEIIVPFMGYGRHSPNQAMIKSERLTDDVLLSFSQISVLFF